MSDFRIGNGYDIHALVKGRDLILGGVKINYEKGLQGHSDGDCLLHAIADSLLGALGLPDIGCHFPDTDPQYKDLNSAKILQLASEKVQEQGYKIVNLDTVILAEEPKLMPYAGEIKQNIASLLSLPIANVGFKAKTNEGLDSVGKKQAIAAQTICLLQKHD